MCGYCGLDLVIAPVNKLVSLTWLFGRWEVFRRFTSHYITSQRCATVLQTIN